MQTLQEVSEIPLLEITRPKKIANGFHVYNMQCDGSFSFKLEDVEVTFEPSSFNRESPKKNILLSIPASIYARLANLEGHCKSQLIDIVEDLEKKCHSNLKPSDKYPATFRAKIRNDGPIICKYFNEGGPRKDPPPFWRKLKCNVVIKFGGIYSQNQSTGCLFEVTHLQFDSTQKPEVQNPFA